MPTKWILGLSLLASLTACAPHGGVPSAVRAGVESHENLDSPTLRSSQIGLYGQGRLLFDQPLTGINSREHYIIEATDWQENGSFTLHSHLNSFALLDGVQVEARRVTDDIQFSISTPGYPMKSVFVLEGALANVDRIRLRLEVHDGGAEGVRFLVWQDSISYQGELLAKLPFVSAANASFDSSENKLVYLSHGRGIRWGLQLNQLTLLNAYREVPYVD